MNRDGQPKLPTAFRERVSRGECVECLFFRQKHKYLSLGDCKYWTMTACADIGVDAGRGSEPALLYQDRPDFVIRQGDTGKRKE